MSKVAHLGRIQTYNHILAMSGPGETYLIGGQSPLNSSVSYETLSPVSFTSLISIRIAPGEKTARFDVRVRREAPYEKDIGEPQLFDCTLDSVWDSPNDALLKNGALVIGALLRSIETLPKPGKLQHFAERRKLRKTCDILVEDIIEVLTEAESKGEIPLIDPLSEPEYYVTEPDNEVSKHHRDFQYESYPSGTLHVYAELSKYEPSNRCELRLYVNIEAYKLEKDDLEENYDYDDEPDENYDTDVDDTNNEVSEELSIPTISPACNGVHEPLKMDSDGQYTYPSEISRHGLTYYLGSIVKIDESDGSGENCDYLKAVDALLATNPDLIQDYDAAIKDAINNGAADMLDSLIQRAFESEYGYPGDATLGYSRCSDYNLDKFLDDSIKDFRQDFYEIIFDIPDDEELDS
jgi:hypothetical protein